MVAKPRALPRPHNLTVLSAPEDPDFLRRMFIVFLHWLARIYEMGSFEIGKGIPRAILPACLGQLVKGIQ